MPTDASSLSCEEAKSRQENIASLSKPFVQKSEAELAYEHIKQYIAEFQSEIDENHEISISIFTPTQEFNINVANVGFYGPNIISFYGDDNDGNKMQVIQHVNQVNIQLRCVPISENQPKKSIGFLPEPVSPIEE
jgi:hypothetical protein